LSGQLVCNDVDFDELGEGIMSQSPYRVNWFAIEENCKKECK